MDTKRRWGVGVVSPLGCVSRLPSQALLPPLHVLRLPPTTVLLFRDQPHTKKHINFPLIFCQFLGSNYQWFQFGPVKTAQTQKPKILQDRWKKWKTRTAWVRLQTKLRDYFFVEKSMWLASEQILLYMSSEEQKLCVCKRQHKSCLWMKNKHPIAFLPRILVLIRFWNSKRNLFPPTNGREISSSLYATTRSGQL